MKDEKLEQLLSSVYSQDIAPPADLVLKTKERLSKSRSPEFLLGAVVTFNLAMLLAFIYFIITSPYSIIYKAALYMVISSVSNCIALAAYVYREQVSSFFTGLNKTI